MSGNAHHKVGWNRSRPGVRLVERARDDVMVTYRHDDLLASSAFDDVLREIAHEPTLKFHDTAGSEDEAPTLCSRQPTARDESSQQ